MAARAAALIAALALGGCLKPAPEARATADAGCRSCHAPHYLREGACRDCHRGDPGARRLELAHARLLTGRAAQHPLKDGPAVREGRRLVETLACRRCHTISGEGTRLATDLDAVVWTREQAALVSSLREPAPNMPRFGLDERQAGAIVAFLLRSGSRDRPQDSYRVLFARSASPASSAFEKSCGGCHRLLRAAGPLGSGSTGPNLSGLFTRFYPKTAPGDPKTTPGDRSWTDGALADWLRNPRASRPTATMPPLALSDDERLRIAAELQGGRAPVAARRDGAALGASRAR